MLSAWALPPISFAPDPKMDVKACAAVREAVGPDIALMLDGYHWYSRTDALYIGRDWTERGTVIRNNFFYRIEGPGKVGTFAVYFDDGASAGTITSPVFTAGSGLTDSSKQLTTRGESVRNATSNLPLPSRRRSVE